MNGDKKSLGELIDTLNSAKLNADTGKEITRQNVAVSPLLTQPPSCYFRVYREVVNVQQCCVIMFMFAFLSNLFIKLMQNSGKHLTTHTYSLTSIQLMQITRYSHMGGGGLIPNEFSSKHTLMLISTI